MRDDEDEKWDSVGNEDVVKSDEFEKFEEERIRNIRESFAKGEKPEKYEFKDVPLLDDNFLNDTHVKSGDTILQADDTANAEREKQFKEHEMMKKFKREQQILHAQSKAEKRRLEILFESESEKKIHLDNPLSMNKMKQVWHVQDHMNLTEFNESQFFHLHDINSDGFLDRQEIRLLLITELNQEYKEENEYLDLAEMSELLERKREASLNLGDVNKDDKLSFQEFEYAVKESEKQITKEDLYWHNLEKMASFTDDEYLKFRNDHVLEIRQMIVDGKLPTNYNYTDVPQLNGYFVNSTHVQRNGSIINLHLQEEEIKYKDFKRFLMMNRYYLEEELAKEVSPEKIEKIQARIQNKIKKRKERIARANIPLSDKQEREVWKKEDLMEPEEFNIEKYFSLHDTDGNGLLSKQEIGGSLMGELGKLYDLQDDSVKEEREAKMAAWMQYVFNTGDRNKDNNINIEELRTLAEKKDEELVEGELDYSEDDFGKFKQEMENV
ncbi:nucleobindin-1 isoform X2 [Eurytemora carolleeae]|uniref:nucleobindin-1 isoform X2 n=2 Tax=Eurytemora carolleeae TaxID=1294199 RepID=UPI000C75F43E|nr:nucleobindin-1 isoform X2 [Eurytemora carolleeae]|eukprot:XP_023341310.1 nucleobindin-1-like isoform X2 [Eurytemora affinis]